MSSDRDNKSIAWGLLHVLAKLVLRKRCTMTQNNKSVHPDDLEESTYNLMFMLSRFGLNTTDEHGQFRAFVFKFLGKYAIWR